MKQSNLIKAMKKIGCEVVTEKGSWKGSLPHKKQRLCVQLNRTYKI